MNGRIPDGMGLDDVSDRVSFEPVSGGPGSLVYAVYHEPCGEPLGVIALRGDGRPGGVWWRVAVPPMSWRDKPCPMRGTTAGAMRLLLTTHRCVPRRTTIQD